MMAALSLIIILSGCGAGIDPAAIALQEEGISPTLLTSGDSAGTLLPPALPTTIVIGTLPPPAIIATIPATETRITNPKGTPTSSPIPATIKPPTETPIPPTFTPPPPPPVVEAEHFWFQRPVPGSGPAWTDKTYPYGSTRGGTLRPHTGVEFQVPEGTPVLAAAEGTVRVAGNDSAVIYGPQLNFYGNLVIIESNRLAGSSPVFQLYGHLSEITVSEGQFVTAGEVVGYSGATGVADGPHLHFEVRVGENTYIATRNPLLWLNPLPQTGVVLGRVIWPSGELAQEAPVTLIRIDGPSPYTATTTYAAGEPNQDGFFDENFVVDDVIPGYYQVIVGSGSDQRTTEMWVFPGRTNFVEIILEG